MDKKIYYLQTTNPEKSININLLEDLFKKNTNWINFDINLHKNSKIDFSYIIGRYENVAETDISYRFTHSHHYYLTNKNILWKTIKNEDEKFYNDYMVKHYDINMEDMDENIKIFKDNKIKIIRPDWTFERSGIALVRSFEDFKKYISKKGKYLYENINKRRPNQKHNFVASNFIQNVLLYKNRVTDFRVFFLVSYINNTYRSYLIKPIIMNLAEYERTDFKINNIKENLTYAHSITDNFIRDLIPSIGYENYKKIRQQILHILSFLYRLIKKYKIMQLYLDQNGGYEIFGLDFISDDKYNVKLIEFNEKTGLGGYPTFIYQNIANNIINSTINKAFDDKYKINLDDNMKNKFIRIRSNKKYL
jgi:hypothetical protein